MQLILDNWCSLNFEASSLVASQLVQLYQDRLDSHHWLFDETSPAMWMALFAFCRRMCYTEFRLALTMGSGTMDRVRFRDWFLRIDELTAEQCRKVVAVLSDPPEGEASLATIELGGRRGVPGQVARFVPLSLQVLWPDFRHSAHPDGQQPPQPDQGLPRHRHQASRQLSEVVPSRRARQASIAKSKSMPRSRHSQTKPAIRELSHVD